MTSEPPRPEGKCDVSFTYYPVFNTTLILGYFWTTLVVMCSLYVGIYRVAQRLQRKTQSAGVRLAALFTMADPELEDEEEDEEEEEEDDEAERRRCEMNATREKMSHNTLKLPSVPAQVSFVGNDSGFKELLTGVDDPISGAESSVIITQLRVNGPLLDDVGWSDGETQVM
ncbi:unnamed protein product [Echinostoma caproni]|uniref:Copper transporter n=1 Tax=Echinostoma caproni TaxID=27848 RepID=A0A183ABF9_9TREM|nr:unnamed protein product [Echinostoma caproni]